ncbi:MAG TPA: hypothetical protein VJB15_07550, partial [Rhodothermia bacterium]|nr:hypothetical protein [Rhodothermia bacterium]
QDDSLATGVAEAFVNRRDLILPLTEPHARFHVPGATEVTYIGMASVTEGGIDIRFTILYLKLKRYPSSVNSIWEGYGSDVLGDPLVLGLVMPDVHAVLSRFGKVCSDCPGPTDQWPPREVSWSDVMAMIVSQYTPVEIKKETVTFSKEIIVDKAAGEDIRLAAARYLIVTPNEPANRAVLRLVREAYEHKTFKENKKKWTEAEKIGFLRTYLAERLPADAEFVDAIKARARGVLPRLGIECDELRHEKAL